MLSQQLLAHHFKSFIRNGQWRRNLGSKILFGFLLLYLLCIAIFLGYNLEKVLHQPGKNPIDLFNSVLIWFFAGDLLVRSFFQSLPILNTLPYLQFSIRRTQIINFVVLRSFWSFFNFMPWFIVIPFAVKILLPTMGVFAVVSYIFIFALVVINNHLLSIFVNFSAKKNSLFYVFPILIAAFFALSAKFGLPVQQVSSSIGHYMTSFNLLIIGILILSILVLYKQIRSLLLGCFFIDMEGEWGKISKLNSFVGMDAFSNLKETGRYIALEINLLVRNKRSRQTLIMLPFITLYLLFFGTRGSQGVYMNIFFLSIMSSIGAAIYGQFILSWESAYFDGIITRKLDLFNYLKAKYYLMATLTIITFLPLGISFYLLGKCSLGILIALFFFALGVNSLIILFFAMFNDGRIDLSKGNVFNYQGVKGSQFMLTMLIMLVPAAIFGLCTHFINETTAILAIGIPGLLLTLGHNLWLKKIIVPLFSKRKYKNLEGYRRLTT